MAIQITQDGRRPSFWIMEENLFGPFRTLQDLIYIYTKFGEDTLIAGGDMAPKWNSTTRLAAEFYFRFQL